MAAEGVAPVRATVTWDGYSWIAVPAVGGVTQARRLDQLPYLVADVVMVLTGLELDPAEVELEVEFPGAAEAAAVRAARSQVSGAERELAARTRLAVLALRRQGVSLRDIATMVGVSFQRVHQIVRSARSLGTDA